jgi:4,5:9,10-diseco-3-hydroxy-5,9,17-trioxoandrosta-1(10),2-diene-4-oate hydrolase
MSEALSYEETSRSTKIGGLALHYHEAGEGAPLILLHGAGPGVSAWSNFSGNLASYAKHFHTYLIDQPGFGGSESPEQYDRHYLSWTANTLVGFLDEMGIEKVHLIGNSLGGSVAVRFALDFPDRADRLVLMGPGSALSMGLFAPRPSEGIRRLLDFAAPPGPTREKMEAFLRTLVFDQSLITDELIDERLGAAIEAAASGAGLQAMQRANQNHAFAEAGELWREASRLKNEVLITWGREDRVQPLDGAFLGFRLLENARLYVFPKCGHWAQIEQREEFERVTIDFIAAG